MRGFSDEQRERIRERLLDAGRESLVEYGPTKTTVEDITDPVGIAPSTFYRFFDSKDDLYLEIIQREITAFQEALGDAVAGADDAYEGLLRLFRGYAEFATDNQIIQQVIIQSDYREVFRAEMPEKLERLQRERMGSFLSYIEELQDLDDGSFGELPPGMVLGVLSTLGLFVLHKDEYDVYAPGYGDALQEFLIETLAIGLLSVSPPDDDYGALV